MDANQMLAIVHYVGARWHAQDRGVGGAGSVRVIVIVVAGVLRCAAAVDL